MANEKWASDDAAGDLLSSILDDTEHDAKAEEERIQAEIQARAAEEQAQKENLLRQRKMEAEAKISAEQDRLGQAAERRTAKMEALKIEDLKASGDWVDPEILAAKQREAEQQRRRDEEMLARKMAQAQAPTPQAMMDSTPIAPPKSNKGLFALAAVALVAVIGAGIALVMIGGGYQVDNTQYSKSVYKPKEVEVAVVRVAVSLIPKAAPAAAVEDDSSSKKKRSRKSRSSRSSRGSKKAKKVDKVSNAAAKKASDLDSILGGDDDLFGGK